MSGARKAHYMARIAETSGRKKLNEAVDYLRAATRPDRIDVVVADLLVIAAREEATS